MPTKEDREIVKAGIYALENRLSSLEEKCEETLKSIPLVDTTFEAMLKLYSELAITRDEIQDLQRVVQSIKKHSNP